MKFRLLLAATLAPLALATPLAQAQALTPQPSQAHTTQPGTAPLPPDDLLYQQLGGRDAIQSFTNDFYERMLKDPRIAHFFDGINMVYLKRVLADYFCVVAGGPCTYDGVSMTNAHAHLGLAKADFTALVENLQLAMDAAGVPFSTQNQLLARMAFFHRDIVTR